MASAKDLRAPQVIPMFQSASAALGVYLVEGRPLSEAEFHFIMNTLFGLQTSLQAWKKKSDILDMPALVKPHRSLRRVMKKPRIRPGMLDPHH